jgi:hypothetical protein
MKKKYTIFTPLLLILFLTFLLAGCSSKKYLQKGEYAIAVQKAVRKLQRNPESKEDLKVLDKAYPKANEQNFQRIKYLRIEDAPDRWEQILTQYKILKSRQELVETVTPKSIDGVYVKFKHIDFDEKIVEAKRKAAEYYYDEALELMRKDNIESYREAYFNLQKVKNFFADYKNVDDLMDEAKYKGTSHALITVKNETRFKLSKAFKDDLINFGIANLNQKWVRYYARVEDEESAFDYLIEINLRVIDISPERVAEKTYTETKKIKSGWEYVLDERGNVKKDSLGNDIKVEKHETVKAEVREFRQKKSAIIEGKVNYIDNYNGQILRSVPIAAEHFFEHTYGTANGDLRALRSTTREIIEQRPAPFPNNMDMIYATKETLRKVIRDVLHDNRNFLR